MSTFVFFRARISKLRILILAVVILASRVLMWADSLVEAVHRGDAKEIRSMLAGKPDLGARDADGNTALHWAALKGNAGLVKELLDRGAVAAVTNNFGASPLLYAVGNIDSVKALLDKGVSVNVVSKFGTTPLMAAARYPESSAVVQLLLDRGADAQARNRAGSDALSAASEAGDVQTFKILLAAGLKPQNVNTAAMLGYQEIVEMSLNAGANLNFDSGHAGHALNFALYGHQPEVAKLLIQRGADLTLGSPRGEHHTPPILWAAYNESGDAAVGRAMIEKGADVNNTSDLGESALDWARERNNKALEKVLLEAGAREGTRVRKQKVIPNRQLPADSKALDALIRESASRAIQLLQRSSDAFLQSGVVKRQNCVSCHQQTLPAVAFGWAMERGVAVDEASIGRQVQDQARYWGSSLFSVE